MDPLKFLEMELEDDDDLGIIIAIYCPSRAQESKFDGDEGFDNEYQFHNNNEDFSDLDLDENPEDIDDEGVVEGAELNPNSIGNTRFGIAIRNNPGASMLKLDPDAAHAREFPEYPDIVITL
ncbi:hypothetical protein GOBAR_DD09012 [Gossypium barbadense]|nr:hypothetical protein GOBAR_DD09012 [Gossypium barbadense]